MHYGVNHLGHFYLTYLLWNKIVKSSFFRIINVSSRAHLRIMAFLNKTTLDFDNINFQNGKYEKNLAYSRSKLYNVMFTKSLA
jgi:retinol dehydrogenase-12